MFFSMFSEHWYTGKSGWTWWRQNRWGTWHFSFGTLRLMWKGVHTRLGERWELKFQNQRAGKYHVSCGSLSKVYETICPRVLSRESVRGWSSQMYSWWLREAGETRSVWHLSNLSWADSKLKRTEQSGDSDCFRHRVLRRETSGQILPVCYDSEYRQFENMEKWERCLTHLKNEFRSGVLVNIGESGKLLFCFGRTSKSVIFWSSWERRWLFSPLHRWQTGEWWLAADCWNNSPVAKHWLNLQICPRAPVWYGMTCFPCFQSSWHNSSIVHKSGETSWRGEWHSPKYFSVLMPIWALFIVTIFAKPYERTPRMCILSVSGRPDAGHVRTGTWLPIWHGKQLQVRHFTKCHLLRGFTWRIKKFFFFDQCGDWKLQRRVLGRNMRRRLSGIGWQSWLWCK